MKLKYKLIIILLFLSGLFLYIYLPQNAFYIKTFGIILSPSNDFVPAAHSFYFQADDRWKNDFMGSSRFTLERHGCLVSITATALNSLGISGDLRHINKLFSKKIIFNRAGEIVWHRISQQYKMIGYVKRHKFNSETVEDDLMKNRLPMVMVKNPQTGSYHWVLIVGSKKNEFLIIDSLRRDKQISGLSRYGKAFGYRVLYLKKRS